MDRNYTASHGKVTISQEYFDHLRDRSFKLSCLEGGGVDCWELYCQSLEDGGYFDEDDE